MFVVGTAGHVDHGKSALVEALTGIDPDRFEEEKRRGMTLDLGFAWLRLPSGREVGIVDVPGHERFIRNMLAGVGAVNAALFVVAANEGWKPQSQEHLAILDLLGVDAGVAVVTKCDATTSDEVEAVAGVVADKLSKTSLAGAPIVRVSASTGIGLDQLKSELDNVLQGSKPPEDHGRPRLWIDRVFTMRGSGTVITGTLTGGGLRITDEIEILPEHHLARVRSIQSHKRSVEKIGPGNRTALNLVGLEKTELKRGDVAVLPGDWSSTGRIGVSLRFVNPTRVTAPIRGAFKFHVGSMETRARLSTVSSESDEGVLAVVDLDELCVLDFGDRFVLRDVGRRETLGGGFVLEPHLATRINRREQRKALLRRVGAKRSEYFAIVLEEAGRLLAKDAKQVVGLSAEQAPSGTVRLPSYLVSEAEFDRSSSALIETVSKFIHVNPLKPGIPKTQLISEGGDDPVFSAELIDHLVAGGKLTSDSEAIKVPGHVPQTENPEASSLKSLLKQSWPSPPSIQDLNQQFDRELISALVRSGELVQVSDDFVFGAEGIDRVKSLVAEEITRAGPMTVAAFRDLVRTTRKYAVPLLEFLDSIAFTRRDGDRRVLGPKAQ